MHHTMESKKEVTYKLFFKSTRSNFDWGWGSQRSLASGEPTSEVIGFIEVAYFSLHFHRDSQDQKDHPTMDCLDMTLAQWIESTI